MFSTFRSTLNSVLSGSRHSNRHAAIFQATGLVCERLEERLQLKAGPISHDTFWPSVVAVDPDSQFAKTAAGPVNAGDKVVASRNPNSDKLLTNNLDASDLDIANFSVGLTQVTSLDPNRMYEMNGLRFYSMVNKVQQQNTITFGTSDAPAWTLIGFGGTTFTPLLVAYGVTTLTDGLDYFHSVAWTQGLYTIANTMAPDGGSQQALGGMMIQPGDGGFYTDSLIDPATTYNITGIVDGLVTTSTPNQMTPGQYLQFANLVNPTGGLANGTGYYVDEVQSPTAFTIKAIDKTDLTQSSANIGGTVTTIASTNDTENWGALIPNGQQMQLTSTDQRTIHTVYAGFVASRILMTKTTDATPEPVLQFSGVQSIEYKSGNLTAGMGFQSANDAQYLQIDALGYYQFVKAGNSADNEAVLTVAVGQNAATPRITTGGMTNGVIKILATDIALTDGDWVHFSDLRIPAAADGSAPPLVVGQSYMVDVVDSSNIRLIDPATGEVGFADVSASAATLVPEFNLENIGLQDVKQSDGTTKQEVVVETLVKHNLIPGDKISFKDLVGFGGSLDVTADYYVRAILGDYSFTFTDQPGQDLNPLFTLTATGGRLTSAMGKVGGFDVGGSATIVASFNGGYQSGDWNKPTDFKIEISGSIAASYTADSGASINGVLTLKGDSETSVGLILQSENGTFTVPAWGAALSGSVSIPKKVGISISGISVSGETASDGTDTISINGSATVTIPNWAWTGSANFGHGETNGLTLVIDPQGKRHVEQFAVSLTADHVKPPGPNTKPYFVENVSLLGASINVDYTASTTTDKDWTLLVGGSFTLAIGDPTPDSNGNWQASTSTLAIKTTPDILELTKDGLSLKPGRYEFDINGPFQIRNFKIVAKNLQFVYQSADPVAGTDSMVMLSGGVTLPQLRGASVQFGTDGASGGLEIDTKTGKWKINGWRITIPTFPVGPFIIQNFILGFSGSGDSPDPDSSTDFSFEAGGQLALFKGGGLQVGVHIKLGEDDGHFVIQDVGASIRNMNPGLFIPGADGFLTDIAFEIDGLPGSVSFSLLFGAVFGDKVVVGAKEYSMIQAILNGAYNNRDIKITGRVLFAGGTLGEADGTVDLNWGTDKYLVDLTGKFFYDSIEGHIYIYFSEEVDAGLFSVKVQVPPNIPIIGGTSLAEADAMYYVDHAEGGKKFMAAWFNFLGHWKYGFEYSLSDDKGFSLIGTKTINGLIADLPQGTGNQTSQTNFAYSTAATEGTNAYGLIHVTWDKPDKNDSIVIASGSNAAIPIYGPNAKPDQYGYVYDDMGIAYQVMTDQSSPGSVMIHIVPKGAFTAPGASYDNPDLYVSLPETQLNVVLTSDKAQTIDPSTAWTGSFAASAPELDSLAVTQPQPSSALGNDQGDDPVTANNATISFKWRGMDPDDTTVSLYYDYDDSGYNGTFLQSLDGEDLTVSDPDGDGWRTVTAKWDLGGLEPGVPLYVYAVIKDDLHAAVATDYVGQLQSVPAVQIQVGYVGNTSVPASALEDVVLEVTPVKAFSITSIVNGVVTVEDISDLEVGDQFVFSDLAYAQGVLDELLFYVTSINGLTFTFAETQGGTPITGAQATTGAVYLDQEGKAFYSTNSKGQVSPHVEVGQMYRFAMSPARGVFEPVTTGMQGLNWKGDIVYYTTFQGNNQLIRFQYQFKVQAAISGTVRADYDDDGKLTTIDAGLAGATVYLDDNNNNVLDPGEQSAVTGIDGTYLFVHQFASSADPAYTTYVKVIPPAGYTVTSSPSTPNGITFPNDGSAQAALTPYDFLVATPITVGGIVYDDANSNGVRDPGEKGLPGVSVSVTPPNQPAINVTTDSSGAWKATAFARGDYQVTVNAPGGGTFTTPSSTTFSTSPLTTMTVQTFIGASIFSRPSATSSWNSTTNSYDAWWAAAAGISTEIVQYLHFYDLAVNATGIVPAQSIYASNKPATPMNTFLGKWTSGGQPSPLSSFDAQDPDGGQFRTELAISALIRSGIPRNANILVDDQTFDVALAYDPSAPDYSTIATIDADGQALIWKYDPTVIGQSQPTAPLFTSNQPLFKFTGGKPVKLLNVNLTGTDQYQAQDYAIIYANANGVLELSIWNHATGTFTPFDVGGRAVVDAISTDLDGNGRNDIAILTADVNSQNYYVSVILNQVDGSMDLLPFTGTDLAIGADGQPATNLSSIRVNGDQQALLWTTSTADRTSHFINAALVTGEQFRLTTAPTAISGTIAAMSAGTVGTPANFVIHGTTTTSQRTFPAQIGSVVVSADGKLSIQDELTHYGGSFSGFDVGVKGVTPITSTLTSGIVYNDANSNGFQDPGEPGLPDFTVRLINPSGTATSVQTSDGTDGRAVGSYSFNNVQAGSYLQIALPSGTWLAQNPPPGMSTNSNGTDGLRVDLSFVAGAALQAIPFDASSDDMYSVTVTSGDLQNLGKKNLVIRTSNSLYVQYFGINGGTSFKRYDVGSAAGYMRPEVELADINGDSHLDIITAGQAGVDVFINIGLGQFKPYVGLLNDKLNNISNGSYTLHGAFTGDADSGISSSKTYTHALNFNGSGAAAVVNGVTFQNAGVTGPTHNLQAFNSVTTDPVTVAGFAGFANNLSGAMATLVGSAFYAPGSAGGERLTLSGLTPGTTYTTTFYAAGYGPTGGRQQQINDSLGGYIFLDENASGPGNGYMFSRTFTATGDEISFEFQGMDPNASFHQYAVTNEVSTLAAVQASPDVFATAFAVVPGVGTVKDRILAVQQGTGTVFEIAWDDSQRAPAWTGKIIDTSRTIIRMTVGDVTAAGAQDLVIYDNHNTSPSPLTPSSPWAQQLWIHSAASGYTSGTLLKDMGIATYSPQVDLQVLPLFAGTESVLFLGNSSSGAHVLMYTAGYDIQTTQILDSIGHGIQGYGLSVGNFIPGSRVPTIVVPGENSMSLLTPGSNPADTANPGGYDPSVPLVVDVTNFISSTSNAAAIGALVGGHTEELMVVRYQQGVGYSVMTYFNATDSYQTGANPGGSLYDFAVIIPGSAGGTIGGNIYYDTAGNGTWDPNDYGITDGVTIYLDLNNNGVRDSIEPWTEPDVHGFYSFRLLPPQTYTVNVELASGWILKSSTPLLATIAAVPGATVYGIDFGFQAKDVGADLNNDHQPDFLLTNPKDNNVYVQLRNGLNRLSTYQIGQLPSADWSAVGIYDLTGNGTVDVLLHNAVTGELKAWDLLPGRGVPAVAGTIDVPYTVPAGFSIVGFGDLDSDGTPELIAVRKSTGEHRLVELGGDSPAESALQVPPFATVVLAGDIDGDGDADLLLRDRRNGHLLAQIREHGVEVELKDLGKPEAGWAVAGITDIVPGDAAEILFQKRSTGEAFAWSIGEDLSVRASLPIDIGTHDGLRLHLAEALETATSALQGTIYRDLTGNGASADDKPLSNVEVRLYLDRNGNRKIDSADGPAIETTRSASNGSYVFDELSSDQYLIQQITPAGYVRTGEPTSGAYAAAVEEGVGAGGFDFYNLKTEPIQVTGIRYHVTHNGVTSTYKTLRGNVRAGDLVKVTFSVPENKSTTVSLVSYRAPNAAFSWERLKDQRLFEVDSGTFIAGRHSLTVRVPNEDFQIDFVNGVAIERFGEPGSNITYTAQKRLISDHQGRVWK